MKPIGAPILTVDFDMDDARWLEALSRVQSLIEETISVVLWRASPFLDHCEVSVLLTNDVKIQTLNREYRQKDRPTNVLSFGSCEVPLDAATYTTERIEGFPFMLGDLVLSYDTMTREANTQNKSLEHHVRHLIVHGMLHLLGYDHVYEEEASTMEDLEIEILERFEIVNPYLIQD